MISRSLLCLAFALASASAAYADHPSGSPLNPEPSNHWIEFGRMDAGTLPARTVYLDNEQGSTYNWDDKYDSLVHLWEVFDTPFQTAKGPATEEQVLTRVDCVNKLIGDHPDVYYYGPDGHIVDRWVEGDHSATESQSAPVERSLGKQVFDFVCPRIRD